MKIYIGGDHNGFKLKEELKAWIESQGHDVEDCGNLVYDPADDYPDYASRVAKGVKNSLADTKGIVLCSSGIGVDIVANKYTGIRCGLGINVEHIQHARAHDDINILSLPADHVTVDQAKEMVKTFLETDFSNEERHIRRKMKIEEIEKRA